MSIIMRNYLRSEKRRKGNFVVTGYPKSGTTWVTHLIGHLAGLSSKQLDIELRSKGIALHTHGVNFEGTSNLLYIIRDPRECVCSAARAAKARGLLGVHEEDGSITETFVRHAISELPGARVPMRQHFQAAIDASWTYVRFEDLKADPQQEMERISDVFGFEAGPEEIAKAIAALDFDEQRKLNSGQPFYAQSSIASWKKLLSPRALDMIQMEVGEQALVFGYDISHRE